jgi:hypothetical protein
MKAFFFGGARSRMMSAFPESGRSGFWKLPEIKVCFRPGAVIAAIL